MPEARIISYLGLALVVYLIASLHSFEGDLDTVGMAIALIAVGLAAVGPFFTWRRARALGSRRVAALSLCAAIAVVGIVQPQTRSLTVLATYLGAISAFGSLLIDLSLFVPEGFARVTRPRLIKALTYLSGAIAAGAGLASIAPAMAPFGTPWLFSAWLVAVPPLFASASVLFALGTRLLPSRFTGSPEQMASNSWAVQGLIPAAAVIGVFGPLAAADVIDLTCWWCRVILAVAVAGIVAGHILLADERYRLSAAHFARIAITSLCAFVPLTAVVALVPAAVAPNLTSAVLAIAALVLAYILLYKAFWPLVWRVVAPAGGRLLEAVDRAVDGLAYVSTFEDLARAVLVPLREASGSPAAEPLLYAFAPEREARLDAAGQPHTDARPISPAVADYLAQKRGEIVLRDPLQASIVKQPPLRSLVDTLVTLDALCILPLFIGNDLEGAVVVPKGTRTHAITLEELVALRRLSRYVASLVDMLSAKARADQRIDDLTLAYNRAAANNQSLDKELVDRRAESRLLKAGRATEALTQPQVAYSESARELLSRISAIAADSSHALLIAEGGTPLEPLAYLIHAQSERREQAFVIGDCACTSAQQCGRSLFGEKRGESELPGWLRLAEGGSLLLLDIPALPSEVQRSLGWALATRQAQAIDADTPYPLNVRIIGTSRVELEPLVAAGVFDAELGKRLESGVARVPPLRDRGEDLPSLVLLELNRASRVLGREAVGIEPAALEILERYDWPGNLDELRSVIERSVAHATGERVYPADLPALGENAAPKAAPSDLFNGTFEDAERRILEQAITNAGGNKSQAARMLGLKRTTFLDKLKRYRLEEDKSSITIDKPS